jgi:hypothetical protein
VVLINPDERTAMSPPDDVAVAPSLPLPLPEFEGVQPVGVVTKVNGSGQRIRRAMHLGERVILVVEAEVDDVGHKRTDDGVKRDQVLKVSDLWELEGKPGATLVRSLRQAYKLSDDHAAGRRVLNGMEQPDPAGPGITVTVDGNGVVLTDTEAAAMRGEVLDGLPHVDIAVLVFADGSRALWPDDFPDGAGPHPEAGERIRKPGSKAKDDPVLISSVLDADTGETLEEWTDEQEAARLLEAEQEAAREEAREDREVHEHLLAVRDAQWYEDLRSASGLVIDGEDLGSGYAFDGFARGSVVEMGRHGEPVTVRVDGIEAGRLLCTSVAVDADVVQLDPGRIEASRILSDPLSGSYRAVGSVKTALGDVHDPSVLECVIDLERRGKNRKGIIAAAELRLSDLGRVTE